MRYVAATVLILGLTAAWVAGGGRQRPAEQAPIISVHTNLVLLRVTVVDRKGALVRGLLQRNFSVYDENAPRPIDFFTSEDTPATLGLVIDCSGSMKAVRSHVIAAATAFAAASHPLDELFTVNFNDVVWPGLPLSTVSAATIERLQQQIALAPARGTTALYDALTDALGRLNAGSHDRHALIVVSDGADNASHHTLDNVIALAKVSGASIYSVAIADEDGHDARLSVLKRLARLTGGGMFQPSRAGDMPAVFTHIADTIRSGYTIGFAPPEDVPAGFRPVRVAVDAGDRRKLVARTRAGYVAGPVRAAPAVAP
jgi:Ca-activated chloride channel family protein